jgi:hypothetical protein
MIAQAGLFRPSGLRVRERLKRQEQVRVDRAGKTDLTMMA